MREFYTMLPSREQRQLYLLSLMTISSIYLNVPVSNWRTSATTLAIPYISIAKCMPQIWRTRKEAWMALKTIYSQFHWSTRDRGSGDPGIQDNLSTPCNCSWDITLKLVPGIQNYSYLNISFQCPFQFSINIFIFKSFLYEKEMKNCRLRFTQENPHLGTTVKLYETWPKTTSIMIHTMLPWQLPKYSAT